ncbi:transposase [Candidatus Tisiphia endosymbiont of Sialis lutaria]|uniref:transposase n=1 Tax=Candidatus Tisiphia endosymbiont of Sialis lutaria TaxID=2029164 RepID=UPI003977B86C
METTSKANKEPANNSSSIKFPVEWSPYPFQLPLWRYLYSGGKKAIAIWHRRAGKDIMGINWITASAIREVGIYWYVYPTYNQAKMSVWDGIVNSGEVVVMDNASFHKSKKTKELIESVGCKLIFLPPYSPDLNPIEKFWANMKRWIKNKVTETSKLFEIITMFFVT